jgi:hypothetical protein
MMGAGHRSLVYYLPACMKSWASIFSAHTYPAVRGGGEAEHWKWKSASGKSGPRSGCKSELTVEELEKGPMGSYGLVSHCLRSAVRLGHWDSSSICQKGKLEPEQRSEGQLRPLGCLHLSPCPNLVMFPFYFCIPNFCTSFFILANCSWEPHREDILRSTVCIFNGLDIHNPAKWW